MMMEYGSSSDSLISWVTQTQSLSQATHFVGPSTPHDLSFHSLDPLHPSSSFFYQAPFSASSSLSLSSQPYPQEMEHESQFDTPFSHHSLLAPPFISSSCPSMEFRERESTNFGGYQAKRMKIDATQQNGSGESQWNVATLRADIHFSTSGYDSSLASLSNIDVQVESSGLMNEFANRSSYFTKAQDVPNSALASAPQFYHPRNPISRQSFDPNGTQEGDFSDDSIEFECPTYSRRRKMSVATKPRKFDTPLSRTEEHPLSPNDSPSKKKRKRPETERDHDDSSPDQSLLGPRDRIKLISVKRIPFGHDESEALEMMERHESIRIWKSSRRLTHCHDSDMTLFLIASKDVTSVIIYYEILAQEGPPSSVLLPTWKREGHEIILDLSLQLIDSQAFQQSTEIHENPFQAKNEAVSVVLPQLESSNLVKYAINIRMASTNNQWARIVARSYKTGSGKVEVVETEEKDLTGFGSHTDCFINFSNKNQGKTGKHHFEEMWRRLNLKENHFVSIDMMAQEMSEMVSFYAGKQRKWITAIDLRSIYQSMTYESYTILTANRRYPRKTIILTYSQWLEAAYLPNHQEFLNIFQIEQLIFLMAPLLYKASCHVYYNKSFLNDWESSDRKVFGLLLEST